MSLTIDATDYRSWEAYGLLDYEDYAERVSEYNQRELGDITEGSWFYADTTRLVNEQGVFRVIYSGSWGNYNSPGANSFTRAELYDINEPQEEEDFKRDKASLEAEPEWLPTEDDDETT